MSLEIFTKRGITRISNLYLVGAVTLLRPKDRVPAPTDPHDPENPQTADTYGKGKRVSIEAAADEVWLIQDGLDDEIALENVGVTPVVAGLPPCLRVKASRYS